MSIKTKATCETCTHAYVCRIKKEIETVKKHIKQDPICDNAYVDITVLCRNYMWDGTTRTTNA